MSARALAAVLAAVSLASPAFAQTAPAAERQPVGASLASDALTGLPSGATVFSLLDTSFAELISDRVDAGGLTPAQAARFGSHGSSWTQTRFRIGEVDISDPLASGTPLFIPGVLGWQRMSVAVGALPLDVNGAGPVVTLVPMRPAASWTRLIEVAGAPSFLLAGTQTTSPPAIARQNGWNSTSVLASGPLVANRVGMVVAASLTDSTHFERSDPTMLRDRLASAFTHLVFTPNRRDEVRAFGWVQRARSPFDHRTAYGQPASAQHDTSLHVQAEWDRRRNADTLLTGFASFSMRRRTTDLVPVTAIVTERLTDGPIPALITPLGTGRAWSIGGKVSPLNWSRRHTPQAGLTLSGGSATARTPFPVRVGELVDGIPARVWDYSTTSAASQWHQITLAAYAGDTLAIHPRVTIDGGLRFEMVRAGAAGNPQGVSWNDWYPSMGLRWELTNWRRIAALVRFHRYGHSLPLGDLAYGDSSAPTADIYRWSATGTDPNVQQRGGLIARAGPGTGGDPDFVSLDPHLERPYVNELTLGLESRIGPRALVRLLTFAQLGGQLIGLVNTGAPASSYVPVTFVDPGTDHAGGQVLVAYDRQPATFGADRYVLMNPERHHSTFVSVEVSGRVTLNRLFLIAAATAGRAEATSANRGFLATENDPSLIGEVFTDPNAESNSRGRSFTERGYTIKLAGTWRFSDTVRLGVSARYQDGQHFARLVIVPDLNQGAEAIRAFVNGKTRFTYTMTFDTRLEKMFDVGGARVTALLDVYNLLNTNFDTEIEEFAVTGPLSRSTSAVRPPRSVHIGLRWRF